ncbi:hypothetical protein KM043_000514 [Ampulex compressa]|nr:hypothetical protein KM043_000514 [Ampulex compressa]
MRGPAEGGGNRRNLEGVSEEFRRRFGGDSEGFRRSRGGDRAQKVVAEGRESEERLGRECGEARTETEVSSDGGRERMRLVPVARRRAGLDFVALARTGTRERTVRAYAAAAAAPLPPAPLPDASAATCRHVGLLEGGRRRAVLFPPHLELGDSRFEVRAWEPLGRVRQRSSLRGLPGAESSARIDARVGEPTSAARMVAEEARPGGGDRGGSPGGRKGRGGGSERKADTLLARASVFTLARSTRRTSVPPRPTFAA